MTPRLGPAQRRWVVAFTLVLTTGASAAPAKGPLGKGTCFDVAHIPEAGGTTFFVRRDGGTAAQCDGKANVAYPGHGTGVACAWSHPFFAFPPGDKARVRGGDRVVIGPGPYRMGYGAPGAEACERDGAFDCVMAAVPSGPDPSHPTRVVGALGPGATLPQLWGAERAVTVLNLQKTGNAEISCLEITDHSDCVEFHTGRLTCQRDRAPFGDWAASGVLASDSSHVTLRSLDIHGLASAGITAGRLSDWLVEDVFITANGLTGWQGDLGENSASSGELVFRRLTVDWNGCGESQKREPLGCWSQEAGGYGDGFGTAATGGHWRFEDSRFLYNTSDGLDLLYHNGSGSITLDRVWAEGNAGNQLKARGEILIRDTIAVGTCAFFRGKPFVFKVDDCRAAGNVVALEPIPGRTQTIERSTITGAGDALLEAVVPLPEAGDRLRQGIGKASCAKLAPLRISRTVLLGGTFAMNGEPTALYYKECGGVEGEGPKLDLTDSVVWKVKDYGLPAEGACPSASHNLCVDPMLDPATFLPRPGSPAAGRGAELR